MVSVVVIESSEDSRLMRRSTSGFVFGLFQIIALQYCETYNSEPHFEALGGQQSPPPAWLATRSRLPKPTRGLSRNQRPVIENVQLDSIIGYLQGGVRTGRTVRETVACPLCGTLLNKFKFHNCARDEESPTSRKVTREMGHPAT